MPSDLIYREDAKDYARYAMANGLNVLDPFYVEDEKSIQMIEAFTNISPYYPPKEG